MHIHNLYEGASAMHLFLAELRDKTIQRDRERFRQNLRKLGFLMAYEISKNLSYEEQEVATPLGIAKAKICNVQPILISVLRASLPFFDGFLEIFPQADCGFIGAYRIEDEANEMSVKMDYVATGSVDGATVILADPMLATGSSIVDAIKILLTKGTPNEIHIASVVAAPEGIDYIAGNLSITTHLWTCAVDQKLNSQAYIVPGLGDAGDLSYGPKI